MTGIQVTCAFINMTSLWRLAFDWYCFQVMRQWGREPEEPQWVYFNATAREESANESLRD